MMRIALDARPLAWHTVSVVQDGQEAELEIRYHVLKPEEHARLEVERLEVLKSLRTDEGDAVDLLIAKLSPERIAAMRADLIARIAEWKLADLAGAPVPCTAANIGLLLDNGPFFRPLWEGLLAASQGARAKNS